MPNIEYNVRRGEHNVTHTGVHPSHWRLEKDISVIFPRRVV
jgi:hypothetical protein